MVVRAAELSENHTDRSRRLTDAAFVAGHAARLGQAHRLVQADLAPGSTESPASVLAAAYRALYQDGDVRSTHRQVSAEIEQARAHALAARDAGLPSVSPRLALITYGALAMTAEDEREAAEMFVRAESHPDAARFPEEKAVPSAYRAVDAHDPDALAVRFACLAADLAL
ncbi:hypothetical protein ACIQWA_19140 [Kitasatospora sp. NPDC098652]|uniref:hypothetical protein n=1 Tax=Kitasatospora sp. NPDC098652 TaxID=3364095 RepID=UPI00381FAAA2